MLRNGNSFQGKLVARLRIHDADPQEDSGSLSENALESLICASRACMAAVKKTGFEGSGALHFLVLPGLREMFTVGVCGGEKITLSQKP